MNVSSSKKQAKRKALLDLTGYIVLYPQRRNFIKPSSGPSII
jgi:hypothetical protein